MLLTEYFSETLVIGHGEPRSSRALLDLGTLGARPLWVDAAARASRYKLLSGALAHAKARRAPGLLLVDAHLDVQACFGRPDDALVERLEASPWDLLYLVHEEGSDYADLDSRSGWMFCDAPPQGLRAMAISLSLLEHVLNQHIDPRLGASHWLTLLAWQAARASRPDCSLAAWPALHAHVGTQFGAFA